MRVLNDPRSDRSPIARRTSQNLARPGWIDSIVKESIELAESMRGTTVGQLRQHTDRLRRLEDNDQVDQPKRLVLAAATVIEAVRQELGWQLFDVQIHAGVIVSCGAVAEMQTGEGKTLSVVLPAYLQSLFGRGVHVATPNSYLAQRDFHNLSPVYARLGISTGLLQDNDPDHLKRDAYRADITYGPGHSFGFDYLRDQRTLQRSESQELGRRTIDRLRNVTAENDLLQRGLNVAIIDEIDHVLVDDAVSPLVLTDAVAGEAFDAEIHRNSRQLIESMTRGIDYDCDAAGAIELTQVGFDRVYADQPMAADPNLVRSWHEYVVLALQARDRLVRDMDYVVRDAEIQIVDISTGRIYADRSWSGGLHQAVAAREGLPIPHQSIPQATITRQRFYRYYKSLSGMTGTATGCEQEFASVYGIAVAAVPLRISSQRVHLPPYIAPTWKEKLSKIAAEVASVHADGRPVLIGTASIAQSHSVADRLDSLGLSYRLLNGLQDEDEALVIAHAGEVGAITIATNLAGRGTDIALAPSVAQRGGLHVIAVEHHSLARVDRQLIGRCARCGDPGSVRSYLAASDTLVKRHAPWIGRAILRWDKQGRDVPFTLDHAIQRAQDYQQSQQTVTRLQMLKADKQTESMHTKNDTLPSGCWQL